MHLDSPADSFYDEMDNMGKNPFLDESMGAGALREDEER